MVRPNYLAAGDEARLFPVLTPSSKEGRTTSILLACMSGVDELSRALFAGLGQRTGKRSKLECFTEIEFVGQKEKSRDRPDGLLVLRAGNKEWRALLEAKVGSQKLDVVQIEKYRKLAKENQIDCLITISNEFATTPKHHPLEAVRKSRSKVPVFHWSWMSILTTASLLIQNDKVEDNDQLFIIRELLRFLTHESAGVSNFERMPPEWTALNKLVSAGGKIPLKSEEANSVLSAWHQECKDLTLILSRQTETVVSEGLSRNHFQDPSLRLKDEYDHLRETCQLVSSLVIPDAAALIEIVADIQRRTVEVGMSIKAPGDRKSSKARMNWLLRQLKEDMPDDLQIRCAWPGRSESTQFPYADIVSDPSIIGEGKESLQVREFRVFISRRLGGRFTQQSNFIADLEDVIPEFYQLVGQNLSAWQKKPPKIKADKTQPVEEFVEPSLG